MPYPNVLNNACLIVAHPDDEIIFASSIVKKVKKIIICFGENEFKKNIGKSRIKMIEDFPFHNIIFLNLKETNYFLKELTKKKLSRNFIFFKRSKIEKLFHNLKDHEKYNKFNNKLRKKIVRNLKDIDTVISHNPWGEYGHFDHINLFKITKEISICNDLNFLCFGYLSKNTFQNFKHSIKHERVNKVLKLSTNKEVYEQLKNIYLKYRCWTWYEKYKLPKTETFMILRLSKSLRKEKKFFDKKISLNILPMSGIHTGLIKSPILTYPQNKIKTFMVLHYLNILWVLSLPVRILKNIGNFFKKF